MNVEHRLSILANASRALATPIDYLSTLHTIAEVALPELAEWAIVFLEQEQQMLPAVHAPETDAIAAIAHALSPDEDWNHPVARALRSGTAIVIANDDARPAHREVLEAAGASAVVVVPLIARGRSMGVVMLGRAQPYDAGDIAVLEELGRRAGSALDTAYLFEAERRTNERLSEAVARQQEADRRKDEFLAILGHELRNPLAPIITALDLMAMSGKPGFEREREVIRRQAEHLTRLVEDLLDISRITREKIQLRKEPIELAQVIARAVETQSPLLEQRRHRLVVDVPRDGLIVEADPVRLAQVFGNLLANAAKYTEPGGRIAIVAVQDAAGVSVTVEDNGNGISPELLAHIFEPFVQSDRTIDRAQGGLGLGLALVRSLAQLHDGSVEAHSDGPGNGSRFVVRLPVPQAVPIATESFDTAPTALVATASARVLVVDDNVDAADTLAAVLRRVGYEVAVAHDAPAALHVAAEFNPAIALLDIGLPVMDGYELARHLRDLLAPPPRLVAVSGYGHDTDLARSKAAGFDVHLGKPVSYDQLVTVLGHLQPAGS
ncbi:MAG TPA: ATP-binding protein [Kofleriaceae bacterium]|nr:ATP-binding protein [Kofleriaceae bacterium]